MNKVDISPLLNPRTIAIIGATDRPRSVGAAVMLNLLTGGFEGPIWPVNPNRAVVCGRQCYPQVSALPRAPDLAVICTPAATVPDLIAQLGNMGARTAIVMSAGTPRSPGADTTLKQAVSMAAQRHGVRVLGPHSLGLVIPGIGLNASFAHTSPSPGDIAIIAQSGAVTTAILDWARGAQIGLSCLAPCGMAPPS